MTSSQNLVGLSFVQAAQLFHLSTYTLLFFSFCKGLRRALLACSVQGLLAATVGQGECPRPALANSGTQTCRTGGHRWGGRTCPQGSPGEIESVILSMFSGGQEEGAGDSGAGSGGKKQGPCLYVNLPCGLRGAPFLRLSFSFASHRVSQSPGWPQIC